MPAIKDTDIYNAIEADTDISDATRKMYISRLKQMTNLFDVSIKDILRKSEYYTKRINSVWHNTKTAKGYFVVLLYIFRIIKEFKDEYETDYNNYLKAFKELDTSINNNTNTNEPSERQSKAYVSFKDIEATRDKLASGSIPRLLLSMYSLIPPSRADFNRVAIYNSKLPTENVEPNYILITKKGAKLNLGEYKTSKKFGAINEMLPNELTKEILASLKNSPREWLFTGKGNEPMTANAYTKFANRLFKNIFDKPLTISVIRHSFINNIDFNTTSIEERQRIAKWMGHSYMQQGKYKWVGEDYQPDKTD